MPLLLRTGHIGVATNMRRVTYLSPVLFLYNFVGGKVGKYMSNVIWKRMIYHGKDLGDFYLVSNTGEVKGVKTGKLERKILIKKVITLYVLV